MNKEERAEPPEAIRFLASVVYQADPLARFLIERMKLGKYAAALAGLAWSLIYLLLLPFVFGGLWNNGEYLGSLQDWHAQLLLLLVFPTTCAFYLWQPRAIAHVYEAIVPDEPRHTVGDLYRKAIWRYLSLLATLGIVLFDAPKRIADYGSWWMSENWLTIAFREVSLAVAFYMITMIAWRQLIAIAEWNGLLRKPTTGMALRTVISYGLSSAFLLALLGLRLGVEAIELPQRPGTTTADYFIYIMKIAVYIAASLAFFYVPLARVHRDQLWNPALQPSTLLKLAAIMALPLLAFLVLKLVL